MPFLSRCPNHVQTWPQQPGSYSGHHRSFRLAEGCISEGDVITWLACMFSLVHLALSCLQQCSRVLHLLNNATFGNCNDATLSYKSKCHELFPMATAFKPSRPQAKSDPQTPTAPAGGNSAGCDSACSKTWSNGSYLLSVQILFSSVILFLELAAVHGAVTVLVVRTCFYSTVRFYYREGYFSKNLAKKVVNVFILLLLLLDLIFLSIIYYFTTNELWHHALPQNSFCLVCTSQVDFMVFLDNNCHSLTLPHC